MYLDELYNYKNQLMGEIVENEDIVSLLTDDSTIIASPESLIYTQIHPYEYIPETIEHGQTFICFDIDIQKSYNKTFYEPTMYVWVFTHRSKLRLPEGGVRTDVLSAELAKMLDGSRMYGLGELELYSVRRFAPMTDYQGKVLTFNARDFSKQHPTGKPIPSNRKDGA